MPCPADILGSQTPDAGPAVVPARGKRAARAYHDQGPSPAPQPTPSGSLAPPGHPSYFPAQSPQDQGPAPGYPAQQPVYQTAPSPAPATDPRSAPPASYQENGPGIPQPPHTAGQRIPGRQRIRIDPDHIPSPVNVQEADQLLYRIEPYLTCSRTPAPLASTDFVGVDQGTLNPSLVRNDRAALTALPDRQLQPSLPAPDDLQPAGDRRSCFRLSTSSRDGRSAFRRPASGRRAHTRRGLWRDWPAALRAMPRLRQPVVRLRRGGSKVHLQPLRRSHRRYVRIRMGSSAAAPATHPASSTIEQQSHPSTSVIST